MEIHIYALINEANDYLQYLGPQGQPLTSIYITNAKFWKSKQIAKTICESFNREWNTKFEVKEFKLTEMENK